MLALIARERNAGINASCGEGAASLTPALKLLVIAKTSNEWVYLQESSTVTCLLKNVQMKRNKDGYSIKASDLCQARQI